MGRRLERVTAVDRRSTPSARADRQEPLPMLRCPGLPGFPGKEGRKEGEAWVFPDHLITFAN